MKQITEEALRSRIVPQPKQFALSGGEGISLTERSVFALHAPEGLGRVGRTAVAQLEEFFREHCGPDCLRADGNAVTITLALGDAPAGVENADQGYALSVAADGICITGFGEKGLRFGAVTLMQLCVWTEGRAELPALTILDWPERKYRGLKIESRYGSNVMEREDWLQAIDDVAAKKMNVFGLSLYCCWCVQYDGRVSEYLYVPIKGHPELKTPMVVRYYSPEEGRWIDCEKLPPIFRDDLFSEICSYAADRGISVLPGWNSYGHNTFLPNNIPEISAKDENGEPSRTGFCTSNEKTYELLFSIYDQIIDDYLKPNGMDFFAIGLDEVEDEIAVNADDIFRKRSPWCKCEKCRSIDKGDLFIRHAIRLIRHLKDKGMKNVQIAGDMLLPTAPKPIGDLGQRMLHAAEEADVKDVLLLGWWSYFDTPTRMMFHTTHPEVGLRGFVNPWNGYYSWSLVFTPLPNIRMMAEIAHRENADGVVAYSMWDRSYDRSHDAIADYGWGFDQAGAINDVTARYARRHFPTRADEAERALRLMDYCTESRDPSYDNPYTSLCTPRGLLMHILSYYNDYAYVRENKPFPRRFPGEVVEKLLVHREDYERALYQISGMAREAISILDRLADAPGCDGPMARRLSYESENFCCLAEDGIALLKIYDLTQKGDYRSIAPLAREREQARLTLMRHCEQAKEKFFHEGAAMRNHSIYMLVFRDMADYLENAEDPKLDLMNMDAIMSDRFWTLR